MCTIDFSFLPPSPANFPNYLSVVPRAPTSIIPQYHSIVTATVQYHCISYLRSKQFYSTDVGNRLSQSSVSLNNPLSSLSKQLLLVTSSCPPLLSQSCYFRIDFYTPQSIGMKYHSHSLANLGNFKTCFSILFFSVVFYLLHEFSCILLMSRISMILKSHSTFMKVTGEFETVALLI